MKIFNTHGRRVFHHDYKDPKTGEVTHYVFKPSSRGYSVPDDLGTFMLRGWPKIFSADEELQETQKVQAKQIQERDEIIAELTARALKAELALEALATKAEAEAAAPVSETAAPGDASPEVKRKPGRPAKVVPMSVNPSV